MKTVTLLLAILAPPLLAADEPMRDLDKIEAALKAARNERRVSVPTQINPPEASAEAKQSLVVVAPTKISVSAKNPLDYSYQIVNRLPYEVFVEVSSADATSLDLDNGMGGLRFGGGRTAILRTQQSALRLLHATLYKDGRRPFTSGCAMTTAKIAIGLEEDESLKDFVGWTGTIKFTLYGYRRSDGAAFQEPIKVPIEITK
jgi:hypothetical protein